MPTLTRTYRAPHTNSIPPLTISNRIYDRSPIVSSRPALLIVEESEEMREHFRAFLNDEYRLSIHTNVQDALAAAGNNNYDLVLIDVEHNREIEAITLIKRLRQIKSCVEVPVIAVTGYMLPQGKAVLKRGSFTAHLPKPFTLRKLKETVRRCIVKRTVMILNRLP